MEFNSTLKNIIAKQGWFVAGLKGRVLLQTIKICLFDVKEKGI